MFFDEYCKELSSAKSLHIDNILSETSFTYIKKSKGPSTEPWGTPALIVLLEDNKYQIKNYMTFYYDHSLAQEPLPLFDCPFFAYHYNKHNL